MEDLILYDGTCNYYNCIYMYVNTINNKKYIGKAIDFKNRLNEHIRRNELVIDKALNKYGINNFKFYIIEYNLTVEELNSKETYYIEYYKTNIKYKEGYNVAQGGDGGNTQEGWSEARKEEFKNKMSEVTKGSKNGMYGKHPTEEQRRRMSEAHKGKQMGSEHPQATAVLQYDLQGNFIKEWSCIKEASDFYNVHHTAIINNCKGRNKTCVNSIWRYKNNNSIDEKIDVNISHACCKKVGQYDKNGILIATYNSIKEAESIVGVRHVGCCCSGKRKTAGGFTWKYLD